MAADTQNRASRRPLGRLVGYARVSTDEQATEAQDMELRSAGCDVIVQEHGSGASRARPGNPGIRERRPDVLATLMAAQKAAYGARIQATANQWLPTVRRMRPDHTWDDIARVLKQRGLTWTSERLRRAVKWMVAEAMADPALLRKSPPRLPEDRLMTLVAGIHSSNADLTLREIAGQLERLHERTPRGGTKWSPSSVKNLIDRARRSGLLAVEEQQRSADS